MYRSFTDRVLGGVCGGLSSSLPVNVWFLRILFILLLIPSQGVAALVYIALWWTMPQNSLITPRSISFIRFLFIVVSVGILIGAWFGNQSDMLINDDGDSFYMPILLGTMSLLFILTQIRGD